MKYSDTESLNKLEEQIYGFEALLKVAKFIPFLFGGSKKVKYLANQVKELKEKIIEMKKYIPMIINRNSFVYNLNNFRVAIWLDCI